MSVSAFTSGHIKHAFQLAKDSGSLPETTIQKIDYALKLLQLEDDQRIAAAAAPYGGVAALDGFAKECAKYGCD